MGIPDKIIFEGEKILELIPQRYPMVMIDKLIVSDEKRTISGFFLKSDNIFCDSKYLYEPGIIENIAQTAAARIGYICNQKQIEVPLGFIGGIKKLKIYQLPETNTEIITTITIEHEIMEATIISGKIENKEGKLLTECEMKIFIQKENKENC